MNGIDKREVPSVAEVSLCCRSYVRTDERKWHRVRRICKERGSCISVSWGGMWWWRRCTMVSVVEECLMAGREAENGRGS